MRYSLLRTASVGSLRLVTRMLLHMNQARLILEAVGCNIPTELLNMVVTAAPKEIELD